MGTTGYDSERLKLEYAQIASKEDNTIRAGVIAALGKLAGSRASMVTKLSGEAADNQRNLLDNITKFQTAQHSGEGAERMRSTVKMAELVVNAPIDFAKAAYAPDVKLLADVQKAANPTGDSNTRDPLIARKAWETFYASPYSTPGSGNLWGTYNEMVKLYGDDNTPLAAEGGLEEKRQRVHAQLDSEKAGAADWQSRYAALVDINGAWEQFLQRNPNLDPNAPATYDAFEADTGIKDRLARVGDTKFIQQLQETVKNTDLGREDLYYTTAQAGLKELDAERDYLKGLLPGERDKEKAETEDTERDLFAAWLKRPDVQWWAKENGFRLGTVKEIDADLQKQIDEGKLPGSVYTKYGVYVPGPDDLKARRFAARQLTRAPERNIFRAAGIGRGGTRGGPETMIEVEVGADPSLYQGPNGKFYKDPADGLYVKAADVGKYAATTARQYENGLIAQRPDGTYVWSTDGDTWSPVDAAAGKKMYDASDVEVPGVVAGLEVTDQPPPKQLLRGFRRSPTIRDVEGSVRLVNEETGKEEYITPDLIRSKAEPNLRADHTRTTPADLIRKAKVSGAGERRGLDLDATHTDVPGPAPTPKLERARRRQTEAIRKAVPYAPGAGQDENLQDQPSSDAFVEEHEQRARSSMSTTPLPARTLQGTPTSPGAERAETATGAPASGLLRPPTPPSTAGRATTAEPAAQGTTIPATTTPTASTKAKDPALALWKNRKRPPPRSPEVEAGP